MTDAALHRDSAVTTRSNWSASSAAHARGTAGCSVTLASRPTVLRARRVSGSAGPRGSIARSTASTPSSTMRRTASGRRSTRLTSRGRLGGRRARLPAAWRSLGSRSSGRYSALHSGTPQVTRFNQPCCRVTQRLCVHKFHVVVGRGRGGFARRWSDGSSGPARGGWGVVTGEPHERSRSRGRGAAWRGLLISASSGRSAIRHPRAVLLAPSRPGMRHGAPWVRA